MKGVRSDPEEVLSICLWPVLKDQKQLRQRLAPENYLHPYANDFDAVINFLLQLLKKDATWEWLQEPQISFDAIKTRLSTDLVLAPTNHEAPFHVVCDTSDFVIDCELMQHDYRGEERVVG